MATFTTINKTQENLTYMMHTHVQTCSYFRTIIVIVIVIVKRGLCLMFGGGEE